MPRFADAEHPARFAKTNDSGTADAFAGEAEPSVSQMPETAPEPVSVPEAPDSASALDPGANASASQHSPSAMSVPSVTEAPAPEPEAVPQESAPATYRSPELTLDEPKRKGGWLSVVLLALLVVAAAGGMFYLVRSQGQGKASAGAENASVELTEPAASDPRDDPDYDPQEDIDATEPYDFSAWQLVIINYDNPIPDDWVVTPVPIRDDKQIDARIADAIEGMVQACYDEGYDTILINQAYRSSEDQQRIWDETYEDYLWQGYSADDAYWATAAGVAKPGYSEHEIGLAADICSSEFDEEYNGPIQSWLAENGWKWGFIQRYPAGKSDITGVKTEGWHFRYVGKRAAKEMHDNNWTLEEFYTAYGHPYKAEEPEESEEPEAVPEE